MSNVEYDCAIEAACVTHTFNCKIHNFRDDVLEKNNGIKEYRMENTTLDSRTQLKLKLLGQKQEVVEIYYRFKTQVRMSPYLKVGGTEISLCTEYKDIDANKWQHLKNIYKRFLLDDIQKYFFHYEWKTSRNLVLHIRFKILVNDPSENLNSLKSNLENVLNSGNFSDVVIKSIEGKEFKVHKVILASRSAVFKSHFKHDTIECHTNIVEAPFESEVVEEVLSYIYCEKVPKIREIPEKILAAANYYQLNELKSLCGNEISKQLTVKNVLETLELAEMYCEDSLKQSALEFISDGNEGLITRTEFWNNISVDLLKSIYEYINSRKDNEIVYLKMI